MSTPPDPQFFEMQVATFSTFEENRRALQTISETMRQQGHPGAAGGAWELVLAELLNNVVEHACAGRDDAPIQLTARWTPGQITATIIDEGHPMPDGRLPGSINSLAEIDPATQPEGGFGWGLIHMLADSIEYSRDERRNHTRVVVSFDGR